MLAKTQQTLEVIYKELHAHKELTITLLLNGFFLLYPGETFIKVINKKPLTNSENSEALIYSIPTNIFTLIELRKSKLNSVNLIHTKITIEKGTSD